MGQVLGGQGTGGISGGRPDGRRGQPGPWRGLDAYGRQAVDRGGAGRQWGGSSAGLTDGGVAAERTDGDVARGESGQEGGRSQKQAREGSGRACASIRGWTGGAERKKATSWRVCVCGMGLSVLDRAQVLERQHTQPNSNAQDPVLFHHQRSLLGT